VLHSEFEVSPMNKAQLCCSNSSLLMTLVTRVWISQFKALKCSIFHHDSDQHNTYSTCTVTDIQCATRSEKICHIIQNSKLGWHYLLV